MLTNYISFESLQTQKKTIKNYFEIGPCVTMKMVF